MKEKSGIEMLEEILSRIITMEKRMDIMDSHIKTILNSKNLATLIENASNTKLDGHARAAKPSVTPAEKPKDESSESGFKNFGFKTTDAAKTKRTLTKDRKSKAIIKIPVRGKLKINNGTKIVPLTSAEVTIYDSNDNLIKKTKTNRAGEWMSQLPPGDYVALFEGKINNKKLLPQNRNFKVPEKLLKGQKEVEVI